MNRAVGKFIALAFTTCFVVMHLHQIGLHEPTRHDAQTFHIEELSKKPLAPDVDNRLTFSQQVKSRQLLTSEHKVKSNQFRQYLTKIEQQVKHPFRQLMLEYSTALYQIQNVKLITLYHHLQQLELSFEISSMLMVAVRLINNDDSTPHILS